jgi:translation initiation factor 5B
LKNINNQDPFVIEKLETKLYEIVGKLSEIGFNSERFDRIEDYTKQIAIVPVSAVSGDGIPELLMVLIGLAQKYLEQSLKLHVSGNAKGTVLEVKETQGLGKTLDVIIYDGILRKNDKIIIGGLEKPIETRIKALLCPVPLREMRDKKTQFKGVDCVVAATGVKVSAPDIDNVIAGMPLQSYTEENKQKVIDEIQKEVQDVIIKTEEKGIIIKADTLGSLEALTFLLKEKNIPVRKASIGKITKKDMTDAESNYDKNPLQAVILGFNVERDADVASSERVKIITSNIIYRIIEEFDVWKEQQTRLMEARELDKLVRPCKLQIIPNFIFRQSNPAIVGVDVLEGKLNSGVQLMKNGVSITVVKDIQHEKEHIQSVTKGKQVAMSLDHVTVGRQIEEGDVLYSYIPEEDFRDIKKLMKYLSQGEIEVLKKIAEIMREKNPMSGI